MAGVTFAAKSHKGHRINCCIDYCKGNSQQNSEFSFHTFPKKHKQNVKVINIFGNAETRDAHLEWKRISRVKNVKPWTKICSLHFKKEDYLFPDEPAVKRYLKKTAIPSFNLGSHEQQTQKHLQNIRNQDRLQRRQNRAIRGGSKVVHKEGENVTKPYMPDETTAADENDDNMLISEAVIIPEQATHAEIGVQVKSGELLPRFFDFIKTDEQLSTSTGIESFSVLDTIVTLASKTYDYSKYETTKQTLHDKIILTLTKLKQNMSYVFLSVLFQWSKTHCAKIFEETIVLLSSSLKVAIPWPSRHEISCNLPLCFEDHENVRIVLDCTEIFIQQPANLCCQIINYSHYKHGETVKFLTGVTPAGVISFISRPYGGKASDKRIFEDSELLSLLEPGDGVMVDKGFLIDETCKSYGWTLIRPPFRRSQAQFSKSDAQNTVDIARARVHIERSNQRLKNFKILSDTMCSCLEPFVHEIFTTISAIVNLSAPILRDERFFKND